VFHGFLLKADVAKLLFNLYRMPVSYILGYLFLQEFIDYHGILGLRLYLSHVKG